MHEVELVGPRLLVTIISDEGGPRVRLRRVTRESPTRGDGRDDGASDWTERAAWLTRELASPRFAGSVIDGILCTVGADGQVCRPDPDPATGDAREEASEQVFFGFDLPIANGRDLRGASLIERKRALRDLLRDAGPRIRLSEHVLGAGAKVFDRACELGVEGVVSKRVDSIYEGGRSPAWLEVKCARRLGLVVGGFTAPHGSRRYLGALLLGSYDAEGRLVYRGKVGSGFGEDVLAQLRPRLEGLRQDQPTFTDPPVGSQARGVTWVRPELGVEVEFGELTDRGKLRHARFKGLRAPVDPAGPAPASGLVESFVGAPAPALGLHKRDLADYVMQVAEHMLAHVRGRALTVVCGPDGPSLPDGQPDGQAAAREGEAQDESELLGSSEARIDALLERVGGRLPEGVQLETLLDRVDRLPDGASPRCLSIDDGLGLVGLIDLGVVELRTRGARLDKRDHPDRLVFQLVGEAGPEFERLLEAASELRARLADFGLVSYVKTSGRDDSLDVVVPVQRRRSYPSVARFCRVFAERLVAASPRRYTLETPNRDSNGSANGSSARGKVAIRHSLNTRAATMIAPYSLCAAAGGLVSTPLRWTEIETDLRPEAFDPASVAARLARFGDDPWTGYFAQRQWITKASFRRLGINPDQRELAVRI